MPVFVSLLRLSMLFLNVYESYKTLRLPPPSARNEGRPSQRALTQRKRDMKGCLAVWIVWSCIITYEGYVEGLVSLFVPFYDEIKSLALLFLIMTRARGAEPIFLHFIRPLLKPYTTTIDMVLDVSRMVGDILFVALAIPAEIIQTWYRKVMHYFGHDSHLKTESNTPPVDSAPLNCPPNLKHTTEDRTHEKQTVSFPKKSNGDCRPSSETDRRPSQTRTRVDQVGQRVQASSTTDTYKIWYPPPSSYSDDEEDARGASQNGAHDISREQKALDEWRQYPAFPSAYPPTPLVVSSTALPGTSSAAAGMQPIASSLIFSEILEDVPQQDFSRSLLPPRKPLNPGFVERLSDQNKNTGVQSDHSDDMSVDSDEDDEEDIFNTTLQTPTLPVRTITRSGKTLALPIGREISTSSSLASRSTTLTTAANDSSLRTQSSSESLSSDALSISDFSSVIGKKRPFPLDSSTEVRTKSGISSRSRSRTAPGSGTSGTLKAIQVPTDTASSSRVRIGTIDDSTSDSVDGQKPIHPKRRKVSQTTKQTIAAVRPVRSRIVRHAAAIKGPAPKPAEVPTSSRQAASTQLSTRRAESLTVRDKTRPRSALNEPAGNQRPRPYARSATTVKGPTPQATSHPPSKAV
ncbi:hypothetical protein H0H92_005171 [Tricholoma furcatifolium]|nr:hypothetical protein H0H92_005171 [Tricholoma furcatifolium]